MTHKMRFNIYLFDERALVVVNRSRRQLAFIAFKKGKNKKQNNIHMYVYLGL